MTGAQTALKPDRRRPVPGPWPVAAVALVILVGALFGVLVRQDPASDSSRLLGDWDLISLEVGGERIPIPGEYGWVGIRFSERGEWSGDFCNHKAGTYRTRDSSIEVTIGFSTAMGCDGDLRTLEEAIEEAFTPGLYDHTLTGDHLELRREETLIVLERRAEPVDH